MYERIETYDDSWFYTFLQSWKFQSIFYPLVGRMLKLFTPTLRRSMPIAIQNSCVNKIPQFCDSFKNALHFSADFFLLFFVQRLSTETALQRFWARTLFVNRGYEHWNNVIQICFKCKLLRTKRMRNKRRCVLMCRGNCDFGHES